MADRQLVQTRIRAGVWEAVLTGATDPPRIEVLHLGAALPGLTVGPAPGGGLALRLPIPAECLNEGVQTFVVRDAEAGETLGHFTVLTGVALEEDIRAEIDLLRAELDLLKRAFRRHCLETAG
jgi:hypothetical protein